MKKNAMLKIAAILLVAVLLTTCAISSTFAKYVTTLDPFESNSARVAKWNVEAATTVTGPSALFKDTYGALGSPAATDTTKNAIASTGTFIVAPGTANSVTVSTAVAKGTPEVSGKITVTPSIALGAGWTEDDDTTFYCPLKIKIGTTTVDCSTYDSVDDINTALAALAFTAYFNAGESLESKTIGGAVAWSWDLEQADNTDDDSNGIGDKDELDTYLGNNTDDTTVKLSFATTVEQTGPAAVLS